MVEIDDPGSGQVLNSQTVVADGTIDSRSGPGWTISGYVTKAGDNTQIKPDIVSQPDPKFHWTMTWNKLANATYQLYVSATGPRGQTGGANRQFTVNAVGPA
jgi:hypothetical protein